MNVFGATSHILGRVGACALIQTDMSVAPEHATDERSSPVSPLAGQHLEEDILQCIAEMADQRAAELAAAISQQQSRPDKRGRPAANKPRAKRAKVLTDRSFEGPKWTVPITEAVAQASDFVKEMTEYEGDVPVMEGDLANTLHIRKATNRLEDLVELVDLAKKFDNPLPHVLLSELAPTLKRIRILFKRWTESRDDVVVDWLGPNRDLRKYVKNMELELVPSGYFLKRTLKFSKSHDYFKDCAVRGLTTVLQWLIDRENKDKIPFCNLVEIACAAHQLETAKAITNHECFEKRCFSTEILGTCFSNAAGKGFRDILEWIVEAFPNVAAPRIFPALAKACQEGQSHLLQWLWDNIPASFPKEERTSYLLECACKGQSEEAVKFVLSLNPLYPRKGLEHLVEARNFELMALVVGIYTRLPERWERP